MSGPHATHSPHARTIRVVSLLPSATESLLAITGSVRAGRVELIGRSHECDWPAGRELADLPVLTGQRTRFESAAQIDAAVRAQLATGQSLYTLDTDLLTQLRPDVILTQDLCQVCSVDLKTVRGVVAAMPPDLRPEIVSLDPTTFEGVFDDLLTIGRAIGLEQEALASTVRLRDRVFRAEEFITPFLDGPTVAFLEWTDPIFIGGHWTPQLIERAGGRHPLNPTVPVTGAGAAAGPVGQTLRAAGKSVRIPEEVLVASRPEAIILCPCGLSLEQAWAETARLAERPWWRDLPAVRAGRVAVVDGSQMFNRPGPRLVDAFEWLVGWLNDRAEVMPCGFPWSVWK
jgi:ABC-type Fe3+-hydroxamate transport system substrate-binding protein